MSFACRLFSIVLATMAIAIVFSPLVAALCQSSPGFVYREISLVAPVVRSLTIAAIASGVALFLGVPFALLVDAANPKLRSICWAAALIALIVPPYIVAESTIVLFGPAGKISRNLALLLGFGPDASDMVGQMRFTVPAYVYTAPAAAIVVGGCLFPVVALAVAGVNRRLDQRMFDAARIIAGRRGVIRIGVHALAPAAIGAGMLVFAIALTESVVPQLLRVQTMGESLYERIQEGDLASAASMSLWMLPVIVLSGVIGVFLLIRARSASLAGLEGEVPQYTSRPSTYRSNIGAAVATLIAVAQPFLVPLAGLSWLLATAHLTAATGESHRVLRASGFFESFRGAWDIAHDDAIRTIWLSAATATLAVAFSVALIRSIRRRTANVLLGLLAAGLAVPAPIVGLGLISLWNHRLGDGVYGSVLIVVLGWLARFFPVALLLTQVALTRVPIEIEQAAAMMGRGRFQRFVYIVLPASAPGLAAAWIAMYVLAATEFATTLLVAPPGAALIAPSIVNLMRRGQDPEIAACQVLMLAVVAVPLFVLILMSMMRRTSRIAR